MPILKAIRDAITRKGYWGLIPTGLPETKYKWEQTDFLRANEISLYVNRAIEKRAEKVGQIQFALKRGDKEITNDPRLELLYRPNKLFTGAQFWSLYQKYKDLTGEAYILIVRNGELFKGKEASELHLLRPDLVQHVYNKETGEIEKFLFGPNKTEYLPEQIIYSWSPDPLNPLRGASLLKAGVRAIETERQISEYQVNVLKNGGKVDGVFKFKASLTKTQLDELKSGYQQEYAGAKQAGKPLFIGGDAEYQRMGLDPAELGYLETKGVTLNDILILTGVPKSVLASVDDVKFDNADASWKIFLRETIKPLLADLSTKLDLTLFGDSKDLDLTFVDPTPEDTKAIIERVKAAHEVNAMTINEKREALGLDPIPDGDVILVPSSSTTLDLVINPPEPQPQQDPTNPDPQQNKAFNGPHPLKDAYVREKYGELYIKKADRREEQFLRHVNQYFQAQEQRITEKLKVTRTYRKKGQVDELFDSTLEIKLGVEEFLPFLTEVLREAGADALKLVGSSPIFILPDHIASWMEKRAQFFVRSINETTFDNLKGQFNQSLDNGEDRSQLVKRIQETYGNISKGRAATIARTEIQSASQKGQLEGYKQAGLRTKIWVATNDHRTRHAHAAADGQEVPLDMPFTVGGEALMFPGDSNGSAENTINCRCSV
jgi:HK97 family phage portal protein